MDVEQRRQRKRAGMRVFTAIAVTFSGDGIGECYSSYVLFIGVFGGEKVLSVTVHGENVGNFSLRKYSLTTFQMIRSTFQINIFFLYFIYYIYLPLTNSGITILSIFFFFNFYFTNEFEFIIGDYIAVHF